MIGLFNNIRYGCSEPALLVSAGPPFGGAIMRRLVSQFVLVAALVGPFITAPPALAAPASAAALTPADRTQGLQQVEARIRTSYVFPERRAAILARLEDAAAAGRYQTADPVEFARRVTEDMQATSKDTHLYLSYEPAWFASALATPQPGEEARQTELENQVARATNHGLVEMRILPGNIRYLKVEGFDWVEGETGLAYDGAMRFLQGGAAVIVDLRGNGGGWVQGSKYLISHFLDANTLIATFHRPDAEPEQYRTVDYLPAGRIRDRPIYLLIDGHSRSAAEMVAYTFQQYRLGELVGARTEGAANVSDDFAVAPDFRLSVSTGRTVQPISGTDWEGSGVAPTIAADPARALEVAQLAAIDRLLPAAAEGMPRNQLAWARPAVEAALHPVSLSDKQLAGFVGRYGEASIALEDHALWLRRPDRPPSRLQPMTRDGLFQSLDNPTLRVRIAPDALELLRIDSAYSSTYRRRP